MLTRARASFPSRARTSARAPRRCSGPRLAPRYDGGDAGPVTTGTGHLERAPERLDAVAKTGEAAADGLARAAARIVGDLEVKGVRRRRDVCAYRGGVCVLLRVGERLGEHVVRGCLDGVVEPCGGQLVDDGDRHG